MNEIDKKHNDDYWLTIQSNSLAWESKNGKKGFHSNTHRLKSTYLLNLLFYSDEPKTEDQVQYSVDNESVQTYGSVRPVAVASAQA